MQCDQLEQILEQLDTGVLPEAAAAHIGECEACRALTTDLDAIRAAALDMSAEEIAPPDHLWISLRNQLEAEGIIRGPRSAPQNMTPAWWLTFQRPALAGAFLSLVLFAAGLISYTHMDNSTQTAYHPQLAPVQESAAMPSADNVFKAELQTVDDETIPGFQKVDSAVADSIRKNLSIVDNFIAVCEKSVREQPDNEVAREYLYGAYEQKAELLATAMSHNVTGGLQ
jgi:hypothetical protein